MTVVPYQQNGTLSTGVQLVAQLERAGVLTETGLRMERFDASYDECEALVALCGRIDDVTRWLIGDLVGYTERKFGEIAPQIMEASRKSEQTLMNLGRISRKVPYERRVVGLTHSHHAEVAALPPQQQTQWLKRAKREGMRRDDLRAHLRAERSTEPCEHEYVCRHCGELA